MLANRMRFLHAPRTALLAAVAAASVLAPGCRADVRETWAVCARVQSSEIDESSGIVASRRYPDLFWVHNDSGDRARFFGIDSRGQLRVQVEIDGARNVDWEDIAVDDSGHVYLGDFGNNRNRRHDLTIYVVDEPDPARGTVQRLPLRRRIPFRYPDQHDFPDSANFNFDCEAMFWADGRIGLLTKHRSDLRTTLYQLDPHRQDEQVAVRITDVEIGSQVTAADCSPDGRLLAVLTYQSICLFERSAAGADFFAGRMHCSVFEGRQCEGVCIDGDRLLVSNEQSEIYCIPLQHLRSGQRILPEPPTVTLPRVQPALDARPGEWGPAGGRLVFDRFVRVPERAGGGVLPGAPALGDSADVRAGWCPEGVLVYASWPLRLPGLPCAPSRPGAPLAYLMLGVPGSGRPCLETGQETWFVVAAGDSLGIRRGEPEDGQPRCSPMALAEPRFIARRTTPERCVIEALLPVTGEPPLAAGASLLLGVVLVEGSCAEPVEFGWAATLDMQPLGNPLLWGRARLGPGSGR